MVGADETTELWRPLLPRFKELPIHVRKSFFKKMGQSRPLFVYFRYFLITISIIEKSIDGVLGIQTLGRRMVGADETTELWRPPHQMSLSKHHSMKMSDEKCACTILGTYIGTQLETL